MIDKLDLMLNFCSKSSVTPLNDGVTEWFIVQSCSWIVLFGILCGFVASTREYGVASDHSSAGEASWATEH